MNGKLTIEAEGLDKAERLDRFLAKHCAGFSRTRLQSLIKECSVRVSGSVCDNPSYKVKNGEVIEVVIPPPEDAEPVPENIPLDIVYEDDDLLVINKQAGLVVHPGAGNWSGTLVNALLYHCGDSLSGIGGVKRPGIVHRLDKDTTGLMLVAKNDNAHAALSKQLADRSLSRCYKALVWHVPDLLRGMVDQPIGRHPSQRTKMAINHRNGKAAVTHYKVLEAFAPTAALVECRLESGRTHQVRVHMAHLGYPLIGDPLYGIQPTAAKAALKKGGYSEEVMERVLAFSRQALHAWKIAFIHPVNTKKMMFEADLPDDMESIISFLKQ